VSRRAANVDAIAAYLATLAASGLKASTITRRCAGIRYMHRLAGHESPTNNEALKDVLSGIRRSIGAAVTRKGSHNRQSNPSCRH
jgi:hypothetical protein